MKKSSFRVQTQPELTKLCFQRNSAFPEDGQASLEIGLRVNVSENVNASGTLVSLGVLINDDVENCIFKMDAEMSAWFGWDEDEIPEEKIPLFLNRNAPALLLGYLRPIVATTIQMSGLPPYNIPFMDFTGN